MASTRCQVLLGYHNMIIISTQWIPLDIIQDDYKVINNDINDIIYWYHINNNDSDWIIQYNVNNIMLSINIKSSTYGISLMIPYTINYRL